MKRYFNTNYSDLIERSGEEVEVLRELTDKEAGLYDVGIMYKIRFADGYVTDAFEDELTKG